MRALSVKQPWAAAIVLGLKDVENRGWALGFRGSFLIHASKGVDFGADWVEQLIRNHAAEHHLDEDLVRAALTRGAIVGAVKIADCVRDSQSRWAADGQFHWVLEAPRVIQKPVYCKGQLGFWAPPQEILWMAKSQLRPGASP